LTQSVILGAVQICIGVTVNGFITFSAGSIAPRFASSPNWMRIQRWVMGSIFGGLAVRMALRK
jgi:threonine/homoserine/homoserine lactone efflux protein